MDHDDQNPPALKRLRTSHACDFCRNRKIRCDGNQPCQSCRDLNQECSHGASPNTRGKSELILEGISRIEERLKHLALTNSAYTSSSPAASVPLTPGPVTSTHSHHEEQPRNANPYGRQFSISLSSEHSQANADTAKSFENAVLDSMHTSNTESILQWPHFDRFPSLRHGYMSNFLLEQTRAPFRMKKSASNSTIGDVTKVDAVLQSFQGTVNRWYPTLSRAHLESVRDICASDIHEQEGLETCMAFLVISLGCSGQAVTCSGSQQYTTTGKAAGEKQAVSSSRDLGTFCFSEALRRLHLATMEVTPVAAHCLFYVALYFAFLRRPLQSWEHISAASTKCFLLLSDPQSLSTQAERERVRRIFWSCYILESDYVAELSVLPQSRIAQIESSISLPGNYHTHDTIAEEEESSLYFLACISMRRLLNRVHHLLYARDTGTALDKTRFPYVVAELDHQLEEWRAVLPPAFSFTCDQMETATEAGAFLRQRYLTCRSVIYRPYLMWMLSKSDLRSEGWKPPEPWQDISKNCKECLDACLLHILNLRGFGHTTLVDTWICSLSMAGAMLVLLAACQVPALKTLLDADVLQASDHLQQLLDSWQIDLGHSRCPSIDQSRRIIAEAGVFIRKAYEQDTEGHSWFVG